MSSNPFPKLCTPKVNKPIARAMLTVSALFAVAFGWSAEPPPGSGRDESGFSALITGVLGYAYRDVWQHTPAGTAPILTTRGEIAREQRMDMVVAFGGFALDKRGQADVVYDLVIIGPGGKETVVGRALEGFRGATPSPNNMHLANAIARFVCRPSEPASEYRFVATVTDRVRHRTLQISTKVDVLADDSPQPVPTDFDEKRWGEWMTGYYAKPDPQCALPMLQWLAREERSNKASVWPPPLGFYEMVLRDNPWLVPRFLDTLARVSTAAPESSRLLYVLGYVFRADPAFLERLPEKHRDTFRNVQQRPWPDPAADILTGDQLDLLWGRFFGSGEFAPIRQLVSVLDYHVFRGKADEFRKLNPKPASTPPEVLKNIIFDSAMWSIRSNAQQHPLVRNYLASLLDDPKIVDDVRVFLAMTVGAKLRTHDGGEIDFSKTPPEKTPPPKN